jgi:hypothetical protein
MPQRPKNMSETEMLSWLQTQYDVNENGCWIWKNCKFPAGYGQVRWGGAMTLVHRLYWLLSGRTIPDGLELCHGPGCSKACYNPEHLVADTRSKNILDKHRDGTFVQTKLTEAQINPIRNDTRTYRVIAEEYGVSRRAICDIKHKRYWAWVLD